MTYLKTPSGAILNWEHVSELFVEEEKYGPRDERWQVKVRFGASPVVKPIAKFGSEREARSAIKEMLGRCLGRGQKQRAFEVVN